MIDLKPYYQMRLALLTYKASFLYNPPKTEDEKYAYDIIQKAYGINEREIFVYAFRLGMRIAIAVFTEPERQ